MKRDEKTRQYFAHLRENKREYRRKNKVHEEPRKKNRKNKENINPKMKKMNRHHLTNKCMGGKGNIENILWIYINRHEVWHTLFKNLDLDQVIALLIRVKSAKENQTESNRIRK